MISIDSLSYQSNLRYMNAMEKFIFSMANLLFCVVSRSILASVTIFLTMGCLTVFVGKIPLRKYVHLLSIPVLFLSLNTLILGISIRKTPLPLFSITFGSWYLTASYETLLYAITIFITAMASVSCLYFLSCNTPMTDILTVLTSLHLPKLLIELMLLIYRYIFVLLESAHALMISAHSRLGNRDYKTSLQSFGALGSSLFIRAIKRSGALFDAMESRCYDGTILVLNEQLPYKWGEILWMSAFELLLVIILLCERYLI